MNRTPQRIICKHALWAPPPPLSVVSGLPRNTLSPLGSVTTTNPRSSSTHPTGGALASLPGTCPGRPSVGRRRADTGEEDSTYIFPSAAGEGWGMLAPDLRGAIPPPPGRLWAGLCVGDCCIPRRAQPPRPTPESAPPEVWRGHQGRTSPRSLRGSAPRRLAPSPLPGARHRHQREHPLSRKEASSLPRLVSCPGVPCTPRHGPRDAHPPISPGGRPCPGK